VEVKGASLLKGLRGRDVFGLRARELPGVYILELGGRSGRSEAVPGRDGPNDGKRSGRPEAVPGREGKMFSEGRPCSSLSVCGG